MAALNSLQVFFIPAMNFPASILALDICLPDNEQRARYMSNLACARDTLFLTAFDR